MSARSLVWVAAFVAAASLLPATALAQLPTNPVGADSGPFGFDFGFTGDTFQQVDYLNAVRFPFTVQDLSRDTAAQPGAPVGASFGMPHTVRLNAYIVENDTKGWQATLSQDFFSLTGGQSGSGTLLVIAGPAARPNYVTVHVDAEMQLPNGTRLRNEDQVRVQLKPDWNGYLQALNFSVSTGQFEIVRIPVRVDNRATYIDTFLLNVSAPEGYDATIPERVVVEPESSEVVYLTIQTPKRGPFVLEEIALFSVQGRSASDSKVVLPSASVIIRMSGAYLAPYWIPLGALMVVSGLLVVNRRLDKWEDAIERRGRPRRPVLSPRQALLLAELKRRDPKAYREKRKQLDLIYAARVKTYRARRREEARREREMAKQAKLELAQERERRKRAAALEKRIAAERAKREKILLAAQAKKRKELEAERQKLMKLREKAQKKADAAQAKADKAASKQAAKDAKAAAKASKEAAKKEKKRKK